MPRHLTSALEILEARIAPAALVTFTDTDGDTVKVTSSKGTMADLTSALHVTAGGQLTLLDLSAVSFGTKFSGAAISVTVSVLGAQGNGVVDVGHINAAGIALGAVLVKGDLGKLTAGLDSARPAVASLTLNSLGNARTSTGAPDLESLITGNLGAVKILGDVDHARLTVTGKLASATISGNLQGGPADGSGSLDVSGTAGAIKVGGAIVGGDGDRSGALLLSDTNATGAIIVNGAITGSGGDKSGSISASTAASIFVGGYLAGGAGELSGSITVTKTGTLTVSGDIYGGASMQAGSVTVTNASGLVSVGGSLYGGGGRASGTVLSGGKIAGVTVQGSVHGGTGMFSGAVLVKDAPAVLIGGSVYGGSSQRGTGIVGVVGLANSITIGGSLIGGTSADSGSLNFVYAKTVKIGGHVSGSVSLNSGSIFGSVVGSVEIGGDVTGVGIGFGSIDTPDTTFTVANSVHIGGTVSGSYLEFGTKTRSDIKVGSVTVDGDWIASDLLVGAVNLGNDDENGGSGAAADNISFGDSHDALSGGGTGSTVPTIGSVVIEGAIRGGGNSGVHYGFVAGKFGAFRAGAVSVLLSATAADLRPIGAPDVSIHELGGTTSVANPATPTTSATAPIIYYTDTDGDTVKVTSSKGTKADLTAALQFSGAQLQKVNFSSASFGTKFAGANLSIAVVALGAQGNGVVDVGYIDATGIVLGNVLVKGDLGSLLAGTADNKPAAGTLTLNSLGARGTTTGAPDLNSTLTGNLGAVHIFGNLNKAQLNVFGKLASVTIGGDLMGGSSNLDGSLSAQGATGAIKIGGDLVGGSGVFSGYLDLSQAATAGAVTIGGSIIGGSQTGSGYVEGIKVSSVSVGGNLLSGTAIGTGGISLGQVGNLTVGGELRGGSMTQSGYVTVAGKSGVVKIGGDLLGGNSDSGFLKLGETVTSLSIQGSLRSGVGNGSGAVVLMNTASVFIGGSIVGNVSATAGQAGGLNAAKADKVVVNGSVFGAGATSGSLRFTESTSLKILGSVSGLDQPGSGSIIATKSLGTLDISGSVSGTRILIGSGQSTAGSAVSKLVHVGGSVTGAILSFGSFDRADLKAGTVSIDGTWSASSLVVGVTNLGTGDAVGGSGTAADNVNFGDSHDTSSAMANTPTVSSIASIIIEGGIAGTAGGSDHFGFVAGQISAFRTGSVLLPVTAGAGNDSFSLGSSGDVTVKELGAGI